jgi:hypothetical protein
MIDPRQRTVSSRRPVYGENCGRADRLFPWCGAGRWNCVLVIALAVMAMPGCTRDGYSELGLVEVTGRITLDGQALPGAKVSFESDDKRTATAITDSAGQYKLMYDSQTPGVTPGIKIVRITLADTDVEGGGTSEGATVKVESIPPRYNRQSELRADVSQSKRTFDFDLKTAP